VVARVSGVALVTGAARGIGAATALRLANEGWTVYAIDRARDDARLPYGLATADDLHAIGARGIATAECDVTDAAALEAVVAGIRERHGGLDVAVAAAGVIAGGVPLWQMPAEEVEAVVAVNLLGAIATARAAIPAMLARPAPRRGRFVAVASAAGRRGLPLLSAYGAAKAGVSGLVRGLACELRGTGITASAVSPGSTRTAMLDESARLYGLASAEDFASQQPIERVLEPAEVADAIAWLTGPGGAAVSGADIAVDGGLTA
jgi:SDR family mycofactocin-dependent oxidoreductase